MHRPPRPDCHPAATRPDAEPRGAAAAARARGAEERPGRRERSRDGCGIRRPLASVALAAMMAITAAAVGTPGARRAHAAPAPPLRSFPLPVGAERTADPARSASEHEAGARGPGAACGTRVESVLEVLREHNARALGEPLPTPHSTDAGEIAVLEDDGTLIYTEKGGNTILDLAQAARAFYRTHGDDYDFLAFYLASGLSTWLGSPTALASAFFIRNPTLGIGLGTFDFGASFGSASRLQTILSMNGLHKYVDEPDSALGPDQFTPLDFLAHEMGHRWLAYVRVDSAGTPVPALLGRSFQHWNFFFDCDASVMEGCNWFSPAPDSFRTDSVTVGYGALDRYLMGLASAAQTDPFFVVNNPTAFDPPGTYVPYSIPMVGLGCRGTATEWTVSDIAAVHGPRVPDAASAPHAFRMAVVLVTAKGNAATPADLAKLEAIRSSFEPYFAAATRYLGTVDCSIDSRAGRVCIAHTPLPDLESAFEPRNVGARVFISQAGIPIDVDPGSVRLFWRAAGAGSWAEIPMAPAGADSFAASFPGVGATGDYEYYLYAASDSSGIDMQDPPAGAASPHVFRVGPDVTPPAIAHVPVPAQGEARMPQTLLARVTDNLGVDSVWVEYSLNGGPPLSVATTRAGRDSFQAAIGAGLDSGATAAYRFAARDLANTPNLAYSNGSFDTLRVGRDWALDFENGAAGLTRAPYWFSYRDAWHLTQLSSSPPGGTAWFCGSETTEYPVHLDANLYLPQIHDVVPGTWLHFDHRYGLEYANHVYAWDGARLEISVSNGPWQVLTPLAGYSHLFLINSNPFQRDTPCWSAESNGWRGESVDLSPYAPGPVRVRFRMLADEFAGGLGWYVDRVRVTYPGSTTSVPVAGAGVTIGLPRPNPARGALRQSVGLARAAHGEWALFDLAGRRVTTLWRGTIPPGGHELTATVPAALPNGLYFTRLTLDGRAERSDRVALIR